MTMIALDIALLVAAAFDAVGCEYFLGGSVASSLQGEPRATNDIDFVVAMPRFRVRAFLERYGEDTTGSSPTSPQDGARTRTRALPGAAGTGTLRARRRCTL